MPSCCAAPNCCTGYPVVGMPEGISFHRFPKDQRNGHLHYIVNPIRNEDQEEIKWETSK